MRRDKITEADVAAVLASPDRTAPTIKGRVNARKRLPRGWVKVTGKQERRYLVIVTVILLRRRPKGI
jgi:hypothetical protein